MANNKLQVISTEPPSSNHKKFPEKPQMHQLQAQLDRMWLIDPKQFDPMRNCVERERIARTEKLLASMPVKPGALAIDLGCGMGVLSKKLRDNGWKVEALDASSLALKKFRESNAEGIECLQDLIPDTRLPDDHYDLVVSTDVIAYLSPNEYRLYFSELARIVKPDGKVVCSSLIDVRSEDSLERFGSFAETEFAIERWKFSYHRLYIRLKKIFEAPSRYYRASTDKDYYQLELQKKQGFSKTWFKWNALKIPGLFWKCMTFILTPITSLLRENRTLALALEKLTQVIWGREGISHVIFVGHRRTLDLPTQDDLESVEPRGKRQVWE